MDNDSRFIRRDVTDPDNEEAFLVAGVWYRIYSDVKYFSGEARFITRTPEFGDFFEMHVETVNIQAIAWPFDGEWA